MVIGVVAATWGGMMREVLAGEATVLARKDVYVTAAMAGSALLLALMRCGLQETAAACLASLAGASVRIVAILSGLEMPGPRWRRRER